MMLSSASVRTLTSLSERPGNESDTVELVDQLLLHLLTNEHSAVYACVLTPEYLQHKLDSLLRAAVCHRKSSVGQLLAVAIRTSPILRHAFQHWWNDHSFEEGRALRFAPVLAAYLSAQDGRLVAR